MPPGQVAGDVQLTALNANAGVRGLEMEGKRLGDLTATAATAGQTVEYNVNSDFAGSTIHVNGRSLLTGNHDTTARAQIANLPIDRVLAVMGQRDLPVARHPRPQWRCLGNARFPTGQPEPDGHQR